MTITILTANGTAQIKNAQSVDGFKALYKYIKAVQAERVPFIVLPPKASAHDLHEITSVDCIDS